MEFSDSQIAGLVQQYMLPFFRLAAMFMAMPIFGSRIVNSRIRLFLALLTTLLVVPILPEFPAAKSLSINVLIYVAQEIVIGVSAGFVFQIVFQVFVLSGQFMAMKMGLGFASMNDPTNGVQTTVLSQFFLMLVTLIFVLVNGHLVMLQFLVESFRGFPPGPWQLSPDMFYSIANLGGWMFASALVFALPVLTSLLFVNIAFGVMSRAAPQLNIFAVGFPFTLVAGLLLIWVGLSNFLDVFDRVSDEGFRVLQTILQLEAS